jgi:beta-ribofuranosylaminobenzene 5'-phosphate synthase
VMVDPPAVEVELSPAGSFAVEGTLADRTRNIVELLVDRWKLTSLPACTISVRSPRDHTGLGVGTQLNLAVATGLRRFLNMADLSLEEMAADVGRGARSAVGTYGFQRGGLIVDAGKERDEALGKLASRVALPDRWRFVLFCESEKRGLAGSSEVKAFAQLEPVPDEITQSLWSITNDEILPAVDQHDCPQFGEAVYRFGRRAGECFATAQSGPFASEEIEELVETIRRFGVSGAGQSSWGPTVYAITEGDEEAWRLIERVSETSRNARYDVVIARPNNCGAIVTS